VIEILQRVGSSRACVWELTLACNLRCKHCGSIAAASGRTSCRSTSACAWPASWWSLVPAHNPERRRAHDVPGLARVVGDWSSWRAGQPNFQRLTWSTKHIDQAQKAGLCGAAFSIDGFEKSMTNFGSAPS